MADAQTIVAEIQKNSREIIRVTRENFKGHNLVQARVWATKEDGSVIPTKAGLSVRVNILPEIIEALKQAGGSSMSNVHALPFQSVLDFHRRNAERAADDWAVASMSLPQMGAPDLAHERLWDRLMDGVISVVSLDMIGRGFTAEQVADVKRAALDAAMVRVDRICAPGAA